MSEKTMSFLSFKLGEEQFAVRTARIIEILEVPNITNVPRSPKYLKGVFNLRGNVAPLIDTKVKFMMDPIEITINTCVVVMEIEIDDEIIVIGSLVDSVHEVLEIDGSEIKPSPTIGGRYNPDFIEGVVSKDDQFIMILDIGKVFSTEDVSILNDSSTEEDQSTAESM